MVFDGKHAKLIIRFSQDRHTISTFKLHSVPSKYDNNNRIKR